LHALDTKYTRATKKRKHTFIVYNLEGSLSSIDLLLSPNLRTSNMKASKLLQEKSSRYEALLLNFPEEMEDRVVDFASEEISYNELLDDIRKYSLIPKPEGSWEYAVKPILEILPQLARSFPNLAILCYGNRENEFRSMEVAVWMTRLTLRTTLTGEVEHVSWREMLQASLEVDMDATVNEAEKIFRKARDSSICLSDLGGRRFKKVLGRAGLDVKVLYTENIYHFTPLMILKRKISLRAVEDQELERLVQSHVEYIRSYIYKFRNRDRAHFEWMYDKIPWLRRRINREEIRLLDNLIDGL